MSSDKIPEQAAETKASPLAEAVHSTVPEVLIASAGDPALGEELALALLKRADLPAQAIERLSKNSGAVKIRAVKMALIAHPRSPRHISVPLVRTLFSFDLMQVALTPAVAADIKMAAEEALINRLDSVSCGEKLSLAHRASDRVAGALLLDSEERVMKAALENPRLTETQVIRALNHHAAAEILIATVAQNPKWSLRSEVRLALLANEKTPMARALEFARALPASQVREALGRSRLPEHLKSCLLESIGTAKSRASQSGQ